VLTLGNCRRNIGNQVITKVNCIANSGTKSLIQSKEQSLRCDQHLLFRSTRLQGSSKVVSSWLRNVLYCDKGTDAVLVVDDDEALIGILTDKDIAYRVVAEGLDARATLVSNIMTRNPTAVTETSSRNEAVYSLN
jgi:signal-transduction protein with cAMP-binding, CBS, and nucleotidyltransferase domain